MKYTKLIFLLLFLASCASHHVNNGLMVQKRRYNAGFHLRILTKAEENRQKAAPLSPSYPHSDRPNPTLTPMIKAVTSLPDAFAQKKASREQSRSTKKQKIQPPQKNAETRAEAKGTSSVQHNHKMPGLPEWDYYWTSDLYAFIFGLAAVLCVVLAICSALYFPSPALVASMVFTSWVSAGFAFIIGAFNLFRHAVFKDRPGAGYAVFAFISPLLVALLWIAVLIINAD